jgi:hypothetical protein
MERFVLNGSERTNGCFTAALFKTQRASFSVRCGAVRWPHSGWRYLYLFRIPLIHKRLHKQWNTKEHTTLRTQAAKQQHGHQSSSAVASKCNIMDPDFDFLT